MSELAPVMYPHSGLPFRVYLAGGICTCVINLRNHQHNQNRLLFILLCGRHCLNSRKRYTSTKTNKDFKVAEAKVIIFCMLYSVIGLGAAVTYGVSAIPLRQIDHELTKYFECERVPHNYNASQTSDHCDRSGYVRLTNPTLHFLAWSLIGLYPVTTLIYFLYKKRNRKTKSVAMLKNSSSSRPTASSSV